MSSRARRPWGERARVPRTCRDPALTGRKGHHPDWAIRGRARPRVLGLVGRDLHEPRAGDAGQARVALAVRLDEELDAVAVLDREVLLGVDRVADGAVRARRRVGRD